MALVFLALLIAFFACRSFFLVTFRYDRTKKFFALKHFVILSGSGLVFFLCMMMIAMAGIAHHVETDAEELAENMLIWITAPGLFVSVVGSLITIVKGLLSLRKVPAKP